MSAIRGMIVAVTVSALACSTAFAADETRGARPRYNQVELQSDAQREVANDTLHAVLFVEAGDGNAAQLANTLNRALNEALKTAAEVKSVRARSGNYSTYPIQDRSQKITGWRGRGEIRIDSRDFQAATALIGRLQSSLQLASLQFSVSAEARKAVENELVAEAIAAFRARADIARQALGGKGFRLGRIAINTGGGAPPPPMFRTRAMVAQAADVAAPQVEGGMTLITVSAAGAIEIE